MSGPLLETAAGWLHPRPWVGVALVFATLGALVGGLAVVRRLARPHPELLRKAVHVGMGLVTLAFPVLFDREWPVWLLCGAAIGGLGLLRSGVLKEGGPARVLHGVERTSLGEMYFPLAVAILFTLAGDATLLYVVPILLLTLADATAAMVGLRYGTITVETGGGRKSLEGCAACFVTGFFAVHVPLLLGSDLDRAACLLIALTIAFLVMMLEFIAWRGLDNLFVPLGAFALLSVYVELSTVEILYRLFATVALIAFVTPWRTRSSLGPSALVAAALFGYFALMVGGWQCLIPPVILFLLPALLWPRRDRPAYHEAAVVVSNVAVGMACLVLYAGDPGAMMLEIYALVFAAHAGFVAASFALHRSPFGSPAWWGRLAGCIALAAVCAIGFASLTTSARGDGWHLVVPLVGLAAIVVTIPIFALARRRFFPLGAPPWRVHLVGNMLVILVAIAHASILSVRGV